MQGSKATVGAAVSLAAVRKVFPGGVTAVDGVSIDVPAGDFVALVGPSGCGKSTLLRIVAGLEGADGGRVEVDGRPVDGPPPGVPTAFVFQDPHLLPWRDLLSNVVLPLELLGVPRAEREARGREAIERVGLADAAGRLPGELSGGMRMRGSLARALVTRPRLLLLDEPFAALDEITRHRLDEELRSLWSSTGTTVLFVTHSLVEAAFLAQRAVVFSRRPARVVLDRPLALPAERTASLRGGAPFAAEIAALMAALEEGER